MRFTDKAFLLHRRPFRDDKQIIDLFAANHGHIRGIWRLRKRAKSGAAPGPFCLLECGWGAASELKRFSALERLDCQTYWPGEAAQLYGLYLNELLYHAMPLDMPEPLLFDALSRAFSQLALAPVVAVAQFEWRLLEIIGLMPDLQRDTQGQLLQSACFYRLGEWGFEVSQQDNEPRWRGEQLLAISDEQQLSNDGLAAARRLNALLISRALEGKQLRSQQLIFMIEQKQNQHGKHHD